MFMRFLLPRLQLSLTAWMLLVSALASLPLLAFALYATHALVREHRLEQERDLLARARAGAAEVRRVLERPAELTVRAVAGLLPASAAGVDQTHGCMEWAPSQATRLGVVAAPLQAELEALPPPAAGRGAVAGPSQGAVRALPSLRTWPYPLERGQLGARWVVPVTLEVLPDGAAAWPVRSWCVDVPAAEFAAVFAEQSWPADWTAGVLDQRGTVVARNRSPEQFVGRPAAQPLRELLRSGLPNGLVDVPSLEGVLLRTAVAPVDDNGWVVAVGVPVASLDAALWSVWRPLLLVGGLCLLLGGGAAVWLARQLGLHVQRAAEWSASTGWPDLDDGLGGQTGSRSTRAAAAGGPGVAMSAPGAAPGWHEGGPEAARPAATQGDAQRQPQPQVGRGVRAPEQAGGVVVELSQLVGELRRARQQAQHASRALHGARHDTLTGLPQRALFMQELRSRLEAAGAAGRQGDSEAAGLALLFIDLDGFKQINDLQGHDAGDHALRQVAAVLRHCVRAGDVAGRLGGDEFVVAVTAPAGPLVATALAVAQRIVKGVQDLGHGMGCSIGLVSSDGRLSAEELLANADQAMYAAKHAGKNRVVVHRRCSACGLPDDEPCEVHAGRQGPLQGEACEWRRSRH